MNIEENNKVRVEFEICPTSAVHKYSATFHTSNLTPMPGNEINSDDCVRAIFGYAPGASTPYHTYSVDSVDTFAALLQQIKAGFKDEFHFEKPITVLVSEARLAVQNSLQK